MLRVGLVKGAGSHHGGVCRCPEEPHNETVRFVESADIASPRFAGDFVADYAVNRAHEVADHIGSLGAGWREPQIAAVIGNRPTAWLTLRASMFAAVSTSSPLGIHDYAIAFSGVAPARLSAQLAVSPLVSAGHLNRQPQLPTCGSRSEEHT